MITDAPGTRRKKATSASVDPLWIVLTPSVDHEAWLKALLKAAMSVGRELVSVMAPPGPRSRDLPPVLYVTPDASLVADADPSTVVVIMPQPETAAEATGLLYSLHLPHSMFHASMLLARATALDPKARILTASQLSRNPPSIELFPGLDVEPPVAERGPSRPAVAGALGLFRTGRPQVGTTVAWSERLFTYDGKSCIDGAPIGVLDVTGRPRTLLYGPYFTLTPGRWKTVMRFAVDDDAAGHEFRFDWGLGSDFVSQSATPAGGGIYEIELEHAVSELGPWQFRILLMEGAFEGHMTFQGGHITRLPDGS